MVLHLEREMDTIILEIVRFITVDESANTLVRSTTGVIRTLIDVGVGRVFRLRASLPGKQGSLRVFAGDPCLGEMRKDEDLDGADVLEVVIVGPSS